MSAPGASDDPSNPSYVGQATFDFAVPFHAPLVSWLLRDDAGRLGLLEDSGLAAGHRALEIGCGRAELALLLAGRVPMADVYAVDSQPAKLARALGRSHEAGRALRVYRCSLERLPFPARSVDRVYFSFALSGFSRALKLAALREAARVLFRDGSLHVLDFAPPQTRWDHCVAALLRRRRSVRALVNGELPALLAAAGFERARETRGVSAPIGRLARWSAVPADGRRRRS
jgi:ubiquinone/menaquinone biosynthesis C-methylase UbiE